jgi:hypothetical protein
MASFVGPPSFGSRNERGGAHGLFSVRRSLLTRLAAASLALAAVRDIVGLRESGKCYSS